jgi:amino acid transporter
LGTTGLILALLGLLLGLWPLWPHSPALSVIAAGMGVLPMLAALLLALAARSRALRDRLPLRLPTLALVLAVAATLLCTSWLVALSLTLQKRPPQGQRPSQLTLPTARLL